MRLAPCLLAILLSAGPCAAEVIALRVAALPENKHLYYVKLLEESLKAAGHETKLSFVKGVAQPRIWDMVAKNQLSLIWGVRTEAREKSYTSVSNPLTNGIAGQRILLVKKGQEDSYAGVKTLEDFRRLDKVGGVGVGWFDAEIWQLNELPVYVKLGDWRRLFSMVANGERGVDYVVRSASEIVSEAKDYPGLAIEKNLVLNHDRDVQFYLSPETAVHQAIIEKALAQADRSGLKKKLIAQYLLPEIKDLNLDKRLKLKLATPSP